MVIILYDTFRMAPLNCCWWHSPWNTPSPSLQHCCLFCLWLGMLNHFFVAQNVLVGWQEGLPACTKTGCWFVGGDDLTGALHVLYFQFVTTTSITLSSNKIQNGYILVTANPGPPGKWPLKRRESENVDVLLIGDHELNFVRSVAGKVFQLCCCCLLIFTLCASCGAVYCNRSCMWVGVCVCVWLGLLPR